MMRSAFIIHVTVVTFSAAFDIKYGAPTYLPPTTCSQAHISNSLRGEAPCHPRDKVIKVPWPNNTDVHRVTPTHVTVRRCSGGCHQDHQSCVASMTRVREVQVILGKCPVSGGKCEKECASVEVEDEVECNCGCRKKEYGEKAEWMSDTCECECKNTVARTECLEGGYVWDSKQCRCGCPQTTSCNSGMEFDQDTCSCEPIKINKALKTIEKAERSESHLIMTWEYLVILVLSIVIVIAILIIMILVRKLKSLKDNARRSTLIPAKISENIFIDDSKNNLPRELFHTNKKKEKDTLQLYNSSSDLSTPPQYCSDQYTDSSFCSDSSDCGNTGHYRENSINTPSPQYQPHIGHNDHSELFSLINNHSQ